LGKQTKHISPVDLPGKLRNNPVRAETKQRANSVAGSSSLIKLIPQRNSLKRHTENNQANRWTREELE